MHSRICPRLWRSARSVSGSPRGESSIVHSSQCLQWYLRRLRNFWKGLCVRVLFAESFRVRGGTRFHVLIGREFRVGLLQHLSVTRFHILQRLESPEIFEGGVHRTFLLSKFTDFFQYFLVCQSHLNYNLDLIKMGWEEQEIVHYNDRIYVECKSVTFVVGILGMLATIIYVKLYYTGNI